jgi:hypothetical protein
MLKTSEIFDSQNVAIDLVESNNQKILLNLNLSNYVKIRKNNAPGGC